MLTPEQITALRDAAGHVSDPITEYLLRDIARRISEVGQLTSTAAFEVWRMQNLGVSQREIKKRLRDLLKVSHRDLRRLLTQSAEVGYNFDIKNLPQVQSIPFYRNAAIQQIVDSAAKLAQSDFTNLSQSLGLVDPFGNALPLQKAYQATTDFAFKQVFTGAADLQTAIRDATRNLANYGVQVIDYESGISTSLEAAARRNIMGGLGLMQEQISQYNHDELGADGWEISAHAGSAPDHEPYQGRQYSDMEYHALNNKLARRIGTLNCGHAAFPIILDISQPQYTPEQLQQFKADNAKGVSYQGKQYTMYEATQKQRTIERVIRKQKRCVITGEASGDEKLLEYQTKLTLLNQEYRRFSKAVGLRTEPERAQVLGFGREQAAQAKTALQRAAIIALQKEKVYNQKREEVRRLIKSDETPKKLNIGSQNKHIRSSKGYIPGRSYIYGDLEEAQRLVNQYHGTGEIRFDDSGKWINKEFIQLDHDIGTRVNLQTGEEIPTNTFSIHYGKNGTHIIPAQRRD